MYKNRSKQNLLKAFQDSLERNQKRYESAEDQVSREAIHLVMRSLEDAIAHLAAHGQSDKLSQEEQKMLANR